ncbi:Atu4866 domain-containing protein [Catenulispora rubra]|uniref:Atu4866 domain-containing protein n=1 Tax=Catenulispora rubra TaxID=280293 RepID=UPI0018926BDF
MNGDNTKSARQSCFGMWVTQDGYISQELRAAGRYDEEASPGRRAASFPGVAHPSNRPADPRAAGESRTTHG